MKDKETEQLRDHSEEMPILDEMKDSYLTYAMSVIVARALPDVRDGLKPSQRRILVAMNDLNLGPRSKHRKCAKIVGDTSGNYHPHGDQAYLRHAGPHGPGVEHALPAGGSAGQLRQHRRRPAGGHAVHRGPPDRPGHGNARGPRQGHRRFRAELRRDARPSRSCCRASSRTCWSTARRASPSAWPRTSRRTTSARSATPCCR